MRDLVFFTRDPTITSPQFYQSIDMIDNKHNIGPAHDRLSFELQKTPPAQATSLYDNEQIHTGIKI